MSLAEWTRKCGGIPYAPCRTPAQLPAGFTTSTEQWVHSRYHQWIHADTSLSPRPFVILGLVLHVFSVGFGEGEWCVTSTVALHRIAYCPQNPLLSLPSSFPGSGNHQSFKDSSFVFSTALCGWNSTVCSLFRWLLSLSDKHQYFLHVSVWLDGSFLSTEYYFTAWYNTS